MKKQLKPILTVIGLVTLVLIISLFPELIGSKLAIFLEEKFSDYYVILIVAAGIVAIIIYTLWSDGDKLFKREKAVSSPQEVTEENVKNIREGLHESYQDRRNNKLAARYPINLELKYSMEGTTTKAPLYDNKTIRSTKIKEELISLFDKHRGRLLIVGEPGSGKTTLLLQLALKLLEREERQIPIVINIATWRSRFSSVKDWFTELLPQMGFSKALTRQLLTENRLLPMFDGLDELAEEKRQACLDAIGYYGIRNETRYVICSRIKEYTQTIDAPVYCEIMVKPLTLVQIKTGLEEIDSPEAKGVLHAIKQDILLAETIKTPFYLNTVQLLFASMKSWVEFGFISDTLEGRKDEIVEKFVEESTSNFAKHPSNHAKKWLAFIAHRMNNNGLVVFELVNLQYDWNSWRKAQLVIASFIYGLVKGMIFSLFYGLFAGVVFISLFSSFYSQSKTLLIGLLVVLITTLLTDLFMGVKRSFAGGLVKISTRENISLSVKSLFKLDKHPFSLWLIGLFVGLVFGWSIDNIVGGLSFGLAFILYGAIEDQLKNGQSYLKVSMPYQRFNSSMWALYFSILQHFHLRYLLYRKGLLPKRLVGFLKQATYDNILEFGGGSWRFRHRILQDYFAEYWQLNYAKIEVTSDLKET